MVDSGATTKFLHRRFIERNSLMTRKLARPIPLYNIDGTENRDGMITEVAVLDMAVGDHRKKVVFVVMDIGEEDVVKKTSFCEILIMYATLIIVN